MRNKDKIKILKNVIYELADYIDRLEAYMDERISALEKQIFTLEAPTDRGAYFDIQKMKQMMDPTLTKTWSEYFKDAIPINTPNYSDMLTQAIIEHSQDYKGVSQGDRLITPQELSYQYNFGSFRDTTAQTADDSVDNADNANSASFANNTSETGEEGIQSTDSINTSEKDTHSTDSEGDT